MCETYKVGINKNYKLLPENILLNQKTYLVVFKQLYSYAIHLSLTSFIYTFPAREHAAHLTYIVTWRRKFVYIKHKPVIRVARLGGFLPDWLYQNVKWLWQSHLFLSVNMMIFFIETSRVTITSIIFRAKFLFLIFFTYT